MWNKSEIDTAKKQYENADKALIGAVINCPGCGKKIQKTSYQKKFCCQKCKDRYWNRIVETRRLRDTPYYTAMKQKSINARELAENDEAFSALEDDADYNPYIISDNY